MAETFVTLYQGNGGRVDIGYEYSQSIENNKTTLTVKAYVVKTNASYYSYRNSPQTFTLTVNGVATTYGWTFNFSNMSLGTRYLITTAVRELTHNADGTVAGIGASVYCSTGTDGLGTINGSTTISIPTIPRTSIPSLSTGSQALGSAITIYTNRAASFTHTIEYYFGNASGTISTGVTDSVAWTLPSSLGAQIPSSLSGVGYIRVITYSGSTYIGERNINFTATVPDIVGYKPTVSGLSVSISGSGRDKTIGKYVQGITRALISFASAATGGASTSSNSINIKRQSDNGNSMDISGLSGTSGLLTLSGVYIITVTTVDTRGRSASTTATITVDAYSVPTIASFTAARISPTTSVNTVRSGAYTYLGGSNTLSVVVSRAPRGGAFTDLETTAGTTSGTFSGTYVSTGNTDTASYEFKLTITDQLGNTASATLTVPTAAVALTIKKDVGIGVGKVWEQGALDVGGDAYVSGNIIGELKVKDTRSTNPTPDDLKDYSISTFFTNVYGDTWRSGISVKGWTDGYQAWQLAAPANSSSNEKLSFRVGLSGTWQTWRDVWHTGNFNPSSYSLTSHTHSQYVGVGQAIETSGSNANGSYVKFGDGTMISWGTNVQKNATPNNAWGSIYYSQYLSFTFPITFVGLPNVQAQNTNSIAEGWFVVTGSTATGFSGYVMRPAVGINGTYATYWTAIGRWK